MELLIDYSEIQFPLSILYEEMNIKAENLRADQDYIESRRYILDICEIIKHSK